MTIPDIISSSSPTGRTRMLEVWSVLGGLAAAFAPATLTGIGALDAVYRAVLVGGVVYIGAHGRRWSWITAAIAITAFARGTALVLCLVALTCLVAATIPKRRSRAQGAFGLAILLNAVFWYPPGTNVLGPIAALTAIAVLLGSGLPYVRSRRRRIAKATLATLGGLAAIAAICLAVSMVLAYGNVRTGSNAARNALASARNGDGDAARTSLYESTEAFDAAAERTDGPLATPAKLVPGLAQQLDAVQRTVAEGQQISSTGSDLAATADYQSLQYDGRLDLAQVADLAGPARRADDALSSASTELDDILDGRLLPPLRSGIVQLADKVTEARRDTALASELLEVTPGLFGADGDRRFLVLFVTPAELRGGGGFVGSYAELTAVDGDVELSKAGRIADIIFAVPEGTRTISGPADYVERYDRYDIEDFPQDVTASPNFPSSAQVMAELYAQSGGAEVDGVISVDPIGLAALLTLTGPVPVEGLDEPLSATNAVELLTKTQYLAFPDDAERGDILTAAIRATFERLTSSQLPAPRALAETLSPAARAGHLRVWSKVDGEQQLFEQVGADGTLLFPTGSDGFSIVQQNVGNNKIDAYLQRTITYGATVDASTGALDATMRIELRNEVPSIELPDPIVGNSRGAPIGTNVATLSIYTRHAVTSATLDGQPIVLGPGSELGLNAWDSPLLRIPPGGKVVLEVVLEGGVDLTSGYELRIVPQPVANPDRFTATLTVDGGSVPGSGTNQATLVEDEALERPTDLHAAISSD